MKTFDAWHENKPCMRCGREGKGRSQTNDRSSRVRRRDGVSGESPVCEAFSEDVVTALPAQWLCAPGGWADPPRRQAQGAENTGGQCLLRVGARWPPSGVCRNPGGGRKEGRIGEGRGWEQRSSVPFLTKRMQVLRKRSSGNLTSQICQTKATIFFFFFYITHNPSILFLPVIQGRVAEGAA